MKKSILTLCVVIANVLCICNAMAAKSSSSSSDSRPRIGHHSGTNGPSQKGWGGKGGYHN